MAHTAKDDLAVDVELGYEQNDIQLRGIIGFAVGLLLLIVITFGLMYALLYVLESYSAEAQASVNPMQMKEKERLPAEPRLQGAPGFGVDGPNGRVNLELTPPQAEYWELEKQWKVLWKEGAKHPETGAVISMPIEQAKEVVLSSGLKAKQGPEAEKLAERSRQYFTDASAGRVAGGNYK